MKTWQPYQQKRAGGGSDLSTNDLDYRPPRTAEEKAEAKRQEREAALTLCDIAARDDNPLDVHDVREVMDMLGLLP